jgi:hypothetical protein
MRVERGAVEAELRGFGRKDADTFLQNLQH